MFLDWGITFFCEGGGGGGGSTALCAIGKMLGYGSKS